MLIKLNNRILEIEDWKDAYLRSFICYRKVFNNKSLIGIICITKYCILFTDKYKIYFDNHNLIEDFLDKEYNMLYPNDHLFDGLNDAKQRVDSFIKKLVNLKSFL